MKIVLRIAFLNFITYAALYARTPRIGETTPIKVEGYERLLSVTINANNYGLTVFCNKRECILLLDQYDKIIAEARFPAPGKHESIVEGPGCNYIGQTNMRRDFFGVYSLEMHKESPRYFSKVLRAFHLDTEGRRIVKIDHEKLWCLNPWFENDGDGR